MTTIRNKARERLEAGEIAVGCGLRMARTVDIAKAMKTCGFDWLFIDLEHGTMALRWVRVGPKGPPQPDVRVVSAAELI